MVSGYDKNLPPEGRYEPDFGGGGRIVVLVLVVLVLAHAFGHLVF